MNCLSFPVVVSFLYYAKLISGNCDVTTSKMGINLGEVFPNFTAPTTKGVIQLHDWLGNDWWAVLFSHPADFFPVSTTEMGRVLTLLPEFEKRRVKVIALSCDSTQRHEEWIKNGKECMVLPSVSKEEAAKLFPQARIQEVPSKKSYLRFTPQPN